MKRHLLYVLVFLFFAVLPGCKDNVDAPFRHEANEYETSVLEWLKIQQLSNGLLESSENGNVVSLYDQSLAAMAFMINDELPRTEAIFDFFNDRRSELNTAPGGFSQFRDRNGIPNGHRWMGDNAWPLIALNNYKALTGRSTYDSLATDLSGWLSSLQDPTDGGLWLDTTLKTSS
ncbi:MAG: hypothetical protein J4F31_08380 [Flavobacteriales bacterium]|nr:hypothetical protein [Flavobacteriales bacterium]